MTPERTLLKTTELIAVVGLSNDPNKASHRVSEFMQHHGYKIVPVNPNEVSILGEKCYPNLESIPFAIDMVNVFRPAKDCPEIAKSAVTIGAKSVWLQLGIVSEDAKDIVEKAGMEFVMDRCLKIEYAMG
jgi:predicted CoA-binding protein